VLGAEKKLKRLKDLEKFKNISQSDTEEAQRDTEERESPPFGGLGG
jgi:hypothetical protein